MIKRTAGLLAALLLVLMSALAVLWSISRLHAVEAGQAEALATLRMPWQPQGRNALAGLWLMDYAIPVAEQRDAVLREDLRMLRTAGPGGVGLSGPERSVAAARYPKHLYGQGDEQRFCEPDDACLQAVRADLKGYRDLVARNQAALQQFAQADDGDHLQTQFDKVPELLLPSIREAYFPATELAVRFADGERAAALEQTCQHVGRWRRLGANTDSMIGTMIAAAYASRGYGRLAADMLAEWPVRNALPKTCVQALNLPGPAEAQGLCLSMRGEYRYMTGNLERGVAQAANDLDGRAAWMRRLPRVVVYDAEKTAARPALQFVPYCQAAVQQAFLEDRDVAVVKQTPASAFSLSCAANLLGCVLSEVASTDMTPYVQRLRDANAQYRMLAALVWLHGQPDLLADPARIASQLPPHLQTAAHPLRYDAASRSLVMPLLASGKGPAGDQAVAMPLPGSRVPVSAPAPVTPLLPDQATGVPDEAAVPADEAAEPLDTPATEAASAAPPSTAG